MCHLKLTGYVKTDILYSHIFSFHSHCGLSDITHLVSVPYSLQTGSAAVIYLVESWNSAYDLIRKIPMTKQEKQMFQPTEALSRQFFFGCTSFYFIWQSSERKMYLCFSCTSTAVFKSGPDVWMKNERFVRIIHFLLKPSDIVGKYTSPYAASTPSITWQNRDHQPNRTLKLCCPLSAVR